MREAAVSARPVTLGDIPPSRGSGASRGLEEKLGVRLLARTPRSVAPTEAGDRLLQSIRPAFATIEDGLAALAEWRDSPSGAVRITTFSYPAKTVLVAKLPAFLLKHPEVQVEVNIDDRLTDIIAEGFDAGIRFGENVAKDMIAVRVGPYLRTIVVATPSYFERHPRPQTPADLEAHNCIGYRLASSGGLLPWEFQRDGREIKVFTSGSFVGNDGDLAAAAVRAGAGLGYRLPVGARCCRGHCLRKIDTGSRRMVSGISGLLSIPPEPSPDALRALIDALKTVN